MVDNQGCDAQNDWVLYRVQHQVHQGNHHKERTGMVPFVALDLLTDEYWDDKIDRLYWHDLEAFIRILPWVFLQYEEGSVRSVEFRQL